MLCSTLGLYSVHSLGPGPLGSIMGEFPLMDLKLYQSLLDHSHKFCITYTPAYLVGRANCRSKILWLGWGPSLFTGNIIWLQEMASSGVLARVTLKLLGVSIAPGF